MTVMITVRTIYNDFDITFIKIQNSVQITRKRFKPRSDNTVIKVSERDIVYPTY